MIYSEVSVAGRFYHDQVSRLFIADSASRLFFKNFFIADYAGWPLFNHSFHLRSFKIDFLSSNYSKVLFCNGVWTKLKWFKFVNANQTSLILWRGNQWKIGKALRQAFYIGKIYWAVAAKNFISLHISDWLTERKWTCSCSLSGPSLHLIGYSSKDVRLILNSWDYLHKMIIQRAQALSLH